MIIVNLKGGLGNQMFQYALGRTLALQNNDTLKLEIEGLDRANQTGDIYRAFGLGHFNIEKNIATASEVQTLKYPYGTLSKGLRWFNFKVLRKTHIVFEPAVLRWTGDIFLDGYWQSPRYFADNRDTLLSEFTLVSPLPPAGATFASQMQSTVSVSIHVRRGDYIKNPRVLAEFGVCSLEYYATAIARIKSIHPNPTFFVFSDDMAWVKENLPVGDSAVFVSDATITDYQELILMSKCEHNIIANSSFSWWGAWLNQNPNKIVVTPTPWFESAAWDKDLIAESWIKLQK
jgi:hypothetical protein